MDAMMIKIDQETASIEFKSNLPKGGETDWKLSFFLELVGFLCFLAILVAGFTSNSTKESKLIWDFEAWKWCLIIFVIFGGAIFTKWLMDIAAFFCQIGAPKITFLADVASKITKQNVKPRVGEKVSHVFKGLKRSVHVFLWLDLVLITWLLLTSNHPNRHTREIIDEITKAILASIVGIIIWVVKTFLLELLALSFIVKRSEKKMEESLKEQEDLKALCDNFQLENSPGETPKDTKGLVLFCLKKWHFGEKKEDGEGMEVLSTDECTLIKKVRHWTPEWMIDEITKTKLPIVVGGKKEETITVERAAKLAADVLFYNIAIACGAAANSEGFHKAPIKYIKKVEPEAFGNLNRIAQKLLQKLEEVIIPVKPLNESIKVRRFRRSDFRKWVVRVYINRLVLLRTINGRDDVVGDLNRIVSLFVLVVILIVWLLVMRFLTTQVMLVILTQLLALNFMVTNTAKTLFEAIVFVFSTRPFDVGDRCKIGNEEMVVHDMNILNTIFKLIDGEKVYYPNSVLLEKNIVNLYGMPDSSDSVEFDIAIDTPQNRMENFEKRIKQYLARERKNWDPEKCSIEMKEEVLDDDKQVKTLAVILNVKHAIQFYNGGDRKKHRDDLVLEVRKIIKDLDIHLC